MSFFSWFKKDNSLQEALIRSYENQLGFLKSQLEYEQQRSDDLQRLLHTQAGLIKEQNVTVTNPDFAPLETGSRTWNQTRRELENTYADPKRTKEITDYIAANESVIVGDYDPDTGQRTN